MVSLGLYTALFPTLKQNLMQTLCSLNCAMFQVHQNYQWNSTCSYLTSCYITSNATALFQAGCVTEQILIYVNIVVVVVCASSTSVISWSGQKLYDCIQELPPVLVELNIQTVCHKCVMDQICILVNRVNDKSYIQVTKFSQKVRSVLVKIPIRKH